MMKRTLMYCFIAVLSCVSCNPEHVDPLPDNTNWQAATTNYRGVLTDIVFISADTGFAMGNEPNTLLKTVDGGRHWEALPLPGSIQSTMISFYPVTSKIILMARDTLYRSADGGHTWTKLATIDGADVSQFEFTSTTVGYACTGHGVYKTIDTGTNWRLVKQKRPGYEAIQFIDAQTGFASGGGIVEADAGRIVTSYGLLAKTTDGGETWIDLDTGDWMSNTHNFRKITSINFVDAAHGFLTTFDMELLRTTNGGSTWEIINSEDLEDPYAVTAFITKDKGFLKANNTIYRTEDGGKTLRKDYYHKSSSILNLYRSPEHKVFAVGREGLILIRK